MNSPCIDSSLSSVFFLAHIGRSESRNRKSYFNLYSSSSLNRNGRFRNSSVRKRQSSREGNSLRSPIQIEYTVFAIVGEATSQIAIARCLTLVSPTLPLTGHNIFNLTRKFFCHQKKIILFFFFKKRNFFCCQMKIIF